jgi:2-hydroxychromene-2-carboxylate isomerase
MRQIDAYIGLGSRYSYLAFTQLDRIERVHRCRFVLHPLSSVELMHLRGRSPFEGFPLSGQYDRDYRRRDAEAWAAYYNVPYIEPKPLPDDHRLLARACWAASRQIDMRTYCGAVFRSVFVDHDDVSQDTCVSLARNLGIDTDIFAQRLSGGAIDEVVTSTAQRAIEQRAFGVPSFIIDDHMFWGNDRLVLLEHYLSGRASD